MKKEPKAFLLHIADSIEHIQHYLNSVTKEDFLNDPKLQDAIMRRIGIIGEAVKNLPDSFKETHHTIDWHKMTGMRNVLIHGYFGIDLNLIWDTAKKDIPHLKEQIEKLL